VLKKLVHLHIIQGPGKSWKTTLHFLYEPWIVHIEND